MPGLVEFRPDRNLIDPDFSGYKLSLEPIPIYEKNLDTRIDTVLPSDDQYSCAFVKIFSLHNYLYLNPNAQDLCYFINENRKIMQVSIGFMNRTDKITEVSEIPRSRDRCPGDFPPDIKFLSSERAVVSDGTGVYHIAAVKKDKWVIIFTDDLPENSILLSVYQSEKNVQILCRTIIEPKFDSILTLLTLDENWHIINKRRVKVAGNISFATIESTKFLTIIFDGQKTPTFLNDSENLEQLQNESKYKWTQTADDVTLLFNVKEIEKDKIVVTINEQHIHVSLDDKIGVEGDFAHPVVDVSWAVENGELVINAKKSEKELGWIGVIEGDTSGIQIQTTAAVEDGDEHIFNNEELEDVDVSSPALLLRLDMEKSLITHQADLSTLQFLHSVTVEPNKPPAISLRHLTDACVWQLQTSEDDSWQQTHLGTFSAFGYVQASKTQRKFIVAPPNLSYVIIADAFKHLYIFRQPSPVNGTLRNRSSGTRINAIAKQQLINLDINEEILGIQANNTLVFVLTSKKFLTIVVNESSL